MEAVSFSLHFFPLGLEEFRATNWNTPQSAPNKWQCKRGQKRSKQEVYLKGRVNDLSWYKRDTWCPKGRSEGWKGKMVLLGLRYLPETWNRGPFTQSPEESHQQSKGHPPKKLIAKAYLGNTHATRDPTWRTPKWTNNFIDRECKTGSIDPTCSSQ